MSNKYINLIKEYTELNSQLLAMKSEFQSYLEDSSIPLNERWSLYRAAPNRLLNNDLYYSEFDLVLPGIGVLDMYDDLYWERHATLDAGDVFERVITCDKVEQFLTSADEDEVLVAIKEHFLKNAYGDLTFDW